MEERRGSKRRAARRLKKQRFARLKTKRMSAPIGLRFARLWGANEGQHTIAKEMSPMSKQEEAGLILKLYELRREETMRTARDWYFREFNPETMADFNNAILGAHSGHLRMVVTYWD